MFLQLSYQQFFRFHIHGDTAPHDAMLLAGILTLCGALSSTLRLRVSLSK